MLVERWELDEGGLGGTELPLSYQWPLARAFRPELQKLETLNPFMYLNVLQLGTSEPTVCWRGLYPSSSLGREDLSFCSEALQHEPRSWAVPMECYWTWESTIYHLTEPSAGFELLRAYAFIWLGSLQNRRSWSTVNTRPEKQHLSPLPPSL